jgi:hypothetical protein
MTRTPKDFRLERLPASVLRATTINEGVSAPLTEFEPVLALSLTRNGGAEVLVAVRDPAAHLTHPDVLSSPTVRLHGVTDRQIGELPHGRTTPAGVPDWLLARITSLMTSKLGGSLPIDRDMVRATSKWQGRSVIGSDWSGAPVTEALTIVNTYVCLPDHLAGAVPSATGAYRTIRWLSRADYRRLMQSGDPDGCGLKFGQPTPVVYGLCNLTTSAVLDMVGELTGPRT